MTDRPKMLWYSGFYDMPLDGVAEYKGKKVWFCVNDKSYKYLEWDDEPDVYYDLYEIPANVMDDLVESHKIFQEMVGYHTDYDPSVYRPLSKRYDEFILYYNDKSIKKVGFPPTDTRTLVVTVNRCDFEKWN